MNVQPVNYRIQIEPDLKRFRFEGTTELLLDAAVAVDEVTLNILQLAIWNAEVRLNDQFVDCPFRVHFKKEELTIFLPKQMIGKINLKITYMGRINDKMAGFYRSQYMSQGVTKHFGVTQFEESEARRAFPCFDHPLHKATFDIGIVLEEDLKVISNSPMVEEIALEDGRRLVKFGQTPRMSTYLVFFAIGEFEFLENAEEVTVRVATTPGMSRYGHFALEFGRKSLQFCETYYDLQYPLSKLDLIAVPDFAFGAMENWGAITFRENLLLRDPDKTSKAGEQDICVVIAHEMAHQWFGNLVTPADWKYLWLNESFATYFGYGVVNHYHPEWDVWHQFLHSQTGSAFDRDGLIETFPIEIPGKEHMVINSSTAPIIYNKGGSILRQIEAYLGKDTFKKGLRHYLKTHQYACAQSNHLWESLEATSHKPISQIMKSWIEQSGYPLVAVTRDGEKLVFSQERFSFLPHHSDQKWLVPLSVRLFRDNGQAEDLTVLLKDKEGSINIGENVSAYKVNKNQTGFYRVKYDEKANLEALRYRIAHKQLAPEDRWGLQNDLYAMVKRGDYTMDEYLDLLSSYTHEDAFLPIMGIKENLFHGYLVLDGQIKEEIAATGQLIFGQVLAKIGYEPTPSEKHTIAILRDQIIYPAALYGLKDAVEFGISRFSALIDGESIHPDVAKSAMEVGALFGHGKTFAWFEQRLESSDSEHERMNILKALGCFKTDTLIKRSLKYALEKVPSRNKFVPILSAASNPYAIPAMWDWFTSHLAELERFHPLHYERVITGIVPLAGLGREEEVSSFFRGYMTEKNLAMDGIKLSLERLKINGRIRRLNGRRL